MYKQIFRNLSLDMPQNEISHLLSASSNIIRKIKLATESIYLPWEDVSRMTDEEFSKTVFPKVDNDN